MTGLIVFLYVFSHSFYLVGSFRNALENSPQEATVRAFALMHSIAALGLFVGSLFLLLKQRSGLVLVRAGAVMLALVHAIGAVVLWKGPGPDLFSSLVVLSQPLYPIFLAVSIPRMSGTSERGGGTKFLTEAGLLSCGALIPWAAALVLGASGVFISSLRPAIALFMTFWCALPFLVAVLIARAWTRRSSRIAILAGGGTGAAIASLYAYGLIWYEGGNIFLLALLQPIVFAALSLGITSALGFVRVFSPMRSDPSNNIY
jgi:hypothetical protein